MPDSGSPSEVARQTVADVSDFGGLLIDVLVAFRMEPGFSCPIISCASKLRSLIQLIGPRASTQSNFSNLLARPAEPVGTSRMFLNVEANPGHWSVVLNLRKSVQKCSGCGPSRAWTTARHVPLFPEIWCSLARRSCSHIDCQPVIFS